MKPRHVRLVGAVAALVAAAGGILFPEALLQGYFFSVLAGIQVALGSLLLLLVFQTTGGRWGQRILPALSVGRRFIGGAILCLVPVLVFLPEVYRWARDPVGVGDRSPFLNWPFFVARAAGYLAVFGGMAWAVGKGRKLSAGGLILYGLVGYFLAIDAVMAIDPQWHSSGFPVVFMANQAVMALCLAIVATTLAPDAEAKPTDPGVWRDLGNLLLAMIVFWSYVAFTQFLIIWMGNLPDQTGWYVVRSGAGWRWVTVLIALANLFIPFFLLLSGPVKTSPKRLRSVAAGVFCAQVLYLYWLVAPSLPDRANGGAHWIDPFVFVAMWSLFSGVFRRLAVKSAPPLAGPT